MTDTSARLSIGFAWGGHTLMHILAALYLTIVLVLEREWHLPYDELIRLWTVGALLIGLGAPLAGWLGDRWSECRMMAAFYLLSGGGAIACGFAQTPGELTVALGILGLGASIYHPVGMAWMVKNAANRGRALGNLGLFGSLGVATAAVVAGGLSDLAGWRMAFLVPGAMAVMGGLALAGLIAAGVVRDRVGDVVPEPARPRDEMIRAFFVLSVTMVCAGLMFNAMQVVLPKLFEERLGGALGGGAFGVGGLVTVVYLLAAVPQLIGGHLADRFALKPIYVICLCLQAPLMGLMALVGGFPVVAVAGLVVIASQVQIPAENMLLARYTPGRHRGLAFGAKFILAFGTGPLAVQLVAACYERFGGFRTLYLILAGLALTAFLAAMLLPGERPVVSRESALPEPQPEPATS